MSGKRKVKARVRKPRAIKLDNVEFDLDDRVFVTLCQRVAEDFGLLEAKKLHAWLSKAIKFLEAKGES